MTSSIVGPYSMK